MVAPAITHRETLTGDLLRALARAAVERVVVYRRGPDALGVASVAGGVWRRKDYLLTIVGPGAGDLACSCPAGRAGRPCKHLACGIFARKYHVYAVRPIGPALDDLFA